MTTQKTNPVFLVGAERSGTTLLRLMLNNHPQISWQSESEYMVDKVDSSENWPPLEDYYKHLLKDRIFMDSGHKIDRSLDYVGLVKSFLPNMKTDFESAIIGATCHRGFEKLLLIWPEARFIHISRDPRDVARSNIGMGWAGNVWHGIERWIDSEKSWESLVNKLSSDDYFELHYEDLVANPGYVLTEICHFLGVNYHANMLNYHQNSTYLPPDRNLIYQWEKKLAKREIQLIEHRVDDLLRKCGYQKSEFPGINPNFIERSYLSIQNYVYKKKFRIKKFGAFLVICNYCGRKLSLHRLEDWSLHRIQHIDRLGLK